MNTAIERSFYDLEDKQTRKVRFETRLVRELFANGSAEYIETNGQTAEFNFSDVLEESQCNLDDVLRDLCVNSTNNDIGFIDSAIRLTRILEQFAQLSAEKISQRVSIDDQEKARRKVRLYGQTKSTKQRC